MVKPADAFLIDATFIVERTHKTFFGSPLLMYAGKDSTFTFGFARNFLRLRQALGIQRGVVVIGKDAHSRTSGQNIADVITFLRNLKIPFVHDPRAGASRVIGSLCSAYSHVLTAQPLLLQLVADGVVVLLVKDGDGHQYTWMTPETIHTGLGVVPGNVLTYLTLTQGLGPSSLTNRQAAAPSNCTEALMPSTRLFRRLRRLRSGRC